MSHDPRTDSAGVPWEGRHFSPTPYAGDDGSAAPALLETLRRFRMDEVGVSEVVESLRGQRLLVPMLAMLGEAVEGPHGALVDKSADLAIVTVAAPDGRRVLPAFTSTSAMTAWNPAARPIPVEAERVAVAAASEGTELVVLDAMSDTEHGLRRSALRALATGERYVSCWSDPDVVAAFAASVDSESAVVAVELRPGDPTASLRSPELLVRLELITGLDQAAIDGLLARLSARWSGDGVIADRVDGLAVHLVSASR
jgi:hypothetical protein